MFHVNLNEPEKRTVSPHRFPLLRSGSFSSRPTTPNSRSTTPNLSRPITPNSRQGVCTRSFCLFILISFPTLCERTISYMICQQTTLSIFLELLLFTPLNSFSVCWLMLGFHFICTSIIQSLENQLQCVSMLIEEAPERLIKSPAKVNVSLRRCSVDESRRRMTCYTLT